MYSSPKLHVQHICRKYWQYVQHMCTSLHIYLVKNTCTSYMQQCTYDVHMVDCMCYICDTEVHLSKSNFFCSDGTYGVSCRVTHQLAQGYIGLGCLQFQLGLYQLCQHIIYCKALEMEKICGFSRSISNCKTLPMKC